jgi:hypothetical protein
MISKFTNQKNALCFVLVASAILSIGNLLNFAQAQDEVTPFVIGDNLSLGNASDSNSTNLETEKSSSSDFLPCDMPLCPAGQACIQSCP